LRSFAEYDPLADIKELSSLDEAEAKRRPVQAIIESKEVLPFLREEYAEADRRLGQEIDEIAASETLHDSMARVGSEVLRGLNQVEPLRAVFDKQEIEEIEGHLKHQLDRVSKFFERYGAVTPEAQELKKVLSSGGMATSQTAEISDTLEDSASVAENEPARKVNVEIDDTGIKISNRIFSRNQLGGQSIMDAKVRLLSFASKVAQDRDYKLSELFKIAYPRQKFNRSKARTLFNWLNNQMEELTGEVLFENNGLRTNNHRYYKNSKLDIEVFDAQSRDSESKEELPKGSPIKITLHNKDIQFGRSPKKIGYAKETSSHYEHHQIFRTAALVVIMQHGSISGSDLWRKVFDIWEQVTDQSDTLNRNTIKSQTGQWLIRGLGHGKQGVVVHNGGMGPKSVYNKSSSFGEVEITFGDDVPKDSVLRTILDKLQVNSATQESAASTISEDETNEQNKFPKDLSLHDVCLTANQLTRFNFLFQKLGWDSLNDEVIQSIERHLPHILDDNQTGEVDEVKDHQESIKRVIDLTKDHNILYKAIEALCEEKDECLDELLKMLEFLMQFNDEESQIMLEILSRAEVRYYENGPRVIDEKEGIIWPPHANGGNGIGIRYFFPTKKKSNGDSK
jgi:hypothetical protein